MWHSLTVFTRHPPQWATVVSTCREPAWLPLARSNISDAPAERFKAVAAGYMAERVLSSSANDPSRAKPPVAQPCAREPYPPLQARRNLSGRSGIGRSGHHTRKPRNDVGQIDVSAPKYRRVQAMTSWLWNSLSTSGLNAQRRPLSPVLASGDERKRYGVPYRLRQGPGTSWPQGRLSVPGKHPATGTRRVFGVPES